MPGAGFRTGVRDQLPILRTRNYHEKFAGFCYRPYHRTALNPDRSPRRRRRILLLLLTLAAAAGGLLLAGRLRDSDFRWDLLLASLGAVHPVWLSASILLILLSYAGRVLRWRVMIRGVAPHPRLSHLLSATLIGFTAVVFFGRPGELVRPYLIARKERVSFSSQMAAWLVERIYDLLIVLLLFGFALTQVDAAPGLGSNLLLVLRTGGYLAAVLGMGCLGFLVLSSLFAGLAARITGWTAARLPARIGVQFQNVAAAFLHGMAFAGTPKVVAELILYSALEWAIILGGIGCLFRAYTATASMSLLDLVVFTGFVAFGSAVQIPGIGGGMQASAILVLTELFALPLETATGMALILWAVTWLVVVPFGMALAFHEGLRWGSLRHVDAEMREPEVV